MGGRGAYYRVGNYYPTLSVDVEEFEWNLLKSMSKEESSIQVKASLISKSITTPIFGEHCTGEIKLNSKGLKDVLSNYHTSTSEKKWALEKLYSKRLRVSYEGYEIVRPGCHNYAKKIAKGFTGFNKYKFSYMGNEYILKTSIIRDLYEQPYYVYKL